jgi:two-component system cell cycle sensor histidine kinase/response regulator CckA
MHSIHRLFSSSGFMPHGFCYTWNPYVIWLNAASDALISLAYYTIPLTLVYFVRRRRDLAFHWIFLGFALFIVACGTTHVMEVWSIWYPMYWLTGVIKAVTATVSVATAAALIPLVPQALALPSPDALRKLNQALQAAQAALHKTNEGLESRIAERTAALAAANAALRAEIEERKRADQRLRESEERFRQLAENISEVLWMRDPVNSQVLYVSSAYETLWGRSRQSLYASPQSWLKAVHPEDYERVRQAVQARQAGGAYDQEYRIVRPDGAIRWVRDRAFPVRDAIGQPDRVVGVAQDVTASKEAEAEQRHRREARFRSLIEQASDLITVLNAEGLIRFQSPSLERVLGYPPAELLGRSAFEFVYPEDLPQAQAAFQRALVELSATISFECRFRHRHGQWRLLQSSGQALPDDDGGEALVVLNSRDVTEQRLLEAQLRQAQKMDALGQLAGGVAHDFNNLLSVIVGHTELLEMGLPRGERLGESVAEIGRAAERAAALTRQLLAFSRRQVLELQALDLNAVVAAAETMLRRLIGEDVRLTTSLQPNLGLVRADPGQLDQVLLNLAVNARDAMLHGGTLSFETRTVELELAHGSAPSGFRPGRYVLLAVSDTGCGMSPEVQTRIFEPFFTTKGIGQGSGLGLAVVHGIVEQCGGHMEVYSLPSLGTTVKIYLPVVEGLTVRASEREPDQPPRGHGETVLLVEDEAPVRAVTLLLLESLGYRVLEAASAEEALRVAQAGLDKIELLMTDVIMPGKNGRELADILRRRDPGVKVLFQTGYAGEAVMRHGIVETETAFLQKPFTLETLAKKVREVLDQG